MHAITFVQLELRPCSDRSPDCGQCWRQNPVRAQHGDLPHTFLSSPLSPTLCHSLSSRSPSVKKGRKTLFYTGIKITIMRLSPEQYRTLGAFLRSRRDTLSPYDVGLCPPAGRRRAKGLRREEIAQLCGISATWYTWLEQGREVSCSAATLTRIASALHLSVTERVYLFELACMKDPDPSRPAVASGLPDLVRTFPEQIMVPCYVLDTLWNACTANKPARDLFVGWLDSGDFNLLRYIFLAPAARDFIDDWESSARRVLAEFRACSVYGDKEQVEKLVHELRTKSPDFKRLWPHQRTQRREGGSRRFHHPVSGPVILDQTTLTFTAWPQYRLVTLRPR